MNIKFKFWPLALVGVICVLLLNPASSKAVNYWSKTYGGNNNDFAPSSQKTADGGIIIAGKTDSFGAGSLDAWIVKLNSDGTVEWQKAYGGSGYDYVHFIQPTSDGGYIAVGYTTSFGAGQVDVWILKLNPDGTITWQKAYGGVDKEEAYYVQETFDQQGNSEGYIVAGLTRSFGEGDYDGWLIKLNLNGTVNWQKTYDMGGFEALWCVIQTSDGGYIATGAIDGGTAAWVLKLNSDGTIFWEKTYRGGTWERGYLIVQTIDQNGNPDGYLMLIESGSWVSRPIWAMRMLKLNYDGAITWQKTYGWGISYAGATSFIQTPNGELIMAALTDSFGAGNLDSVLFHLNSDGTIRLQKIFGDVGDDLVVSVQQILDGRYLATGYTNSFGAGNYDLWVLNLNSNGEIPNCSIIGEISVPVSETPVIYVDYSNASVTNTNAIGLSNAIMTDTNAQVQTQCWAEVDLEGPLTSDVLANPNPSPVNTDIILMASVDDTTTGGSNIASAEYSLDGITWEPMSDAFASPTENVTATLSVQYPGVYDLCVRGTDAPGNLGPAECTFLVVYDPEGGFVTGGGWIWSPQGAYMDDPSLEGKANFGFVSKYKKGANIPTGQTEFQFKVADLNFHSDSYEWLVVAGAKAKYKGTGTINGEGDFKFMLTAIDADINADDAFHVDRFRIKIWFEENGAEYVVYDNARGDDDDMATTEIGGGSIVIHVPRN